MEIEPRHVFFLLFLSSIMILLGGIGSHVIGAPDQDVVNQITNGSLSDKIMAMWDMFNMNYDWLPVWIQWPFRIINWAFAILVARQLWKLVPVIGR